MRQDVDLLEEKRVGKGDVESDAMLVRGEVVGPDSGADPAMWRRVVQQNVNGVACGAGAGDSAEGGEVGESLRGVVVAVERPEAVLVGVDEIHERADDTRAGVE